MKKYPLVAAALLGTALHNVSALDITTSDPHDDKSFSGANLGANGPENNTVQYNAIADQSWDLEGFDWSGTSLSMTGGFNFLTGVGVGTSDVIAMGDIFIYLDQSPYSVPSSSDHDGPWTGSENWDFVIRFARDSAGNYLQTVDGIGYSIVANQPGLSYSLTQNPLALNVGLPWQLDGSFATDGYASYSTGNDAEGFHNTVSGIDLGGILGANDSFYLHTTMRCGNDVLWGSSEAAGVPDGGMTLCLLGLGVGTLSLIRRRQS